MNDNLDHHFLTTVIEEAEPVADQYDGLFADSETQKMHEIREITSKPRTHTHIETLLKHIHEKFSDKGLTKTLIHKLFLCDEHELAYYVPELAYLAIKKRCKPIRKLLIERSQHNESLRRLVNG